MSKLEDLFQTIESHEFSATVNLASNFRTFLHILGSEQPVQSLARQLDDPAAREAVYSRVFALLKDQGEEAYEHPWDSALAAYLWLLAEHDRDLAKAAAAKVLEAPRCWWARKMAEQILTSDTSASSTSRG
jgi:hypothetical protein